MHYKVTKIIKKDAWADGNPRLKLNVIDISGTAVENVTISKKQKDGTEFPGFDVLTEGAEFDARPWVNDKGYTTLFPLDKPKTNGGGMGGGAKAAVEAKAKSIEKSQDRKEEGIMISSTARMATDITVEMIRKNPEFTGEEVRAMWLKWRNWFVNNYENISGKEIISQFEQRTGVKYPESHGQPDFDESEMMSGTGSDNLPF